MPWWPLVVYWQFYICSFSETSHEHTRTTKLLLNLDHWCKVTTWFAATRAKHSTINKYVPETARSLKRPTKMVLLHGKHNVAKSTLSLCHIFLKKVSSGKIKNPKNVNIFFLIHASPTNKFKKIHSFFSCFATDSPWNVTSSIFDVGRPNRYTYFCKAL